MTVAKKKMAPNPMNDNSATKKPPQNKPSNLPAPKGREVPRKIGVKKPGGKCM